MFFGRFECLRARAFVSMIVSIRVHAIMCCTYRVPTFCMLLMKRVMISWERLHHLNVERSILLTCEMNLSPAHFHNTGWNQPCLHAYVSCNSSSAWAVRTCIIACTCINTWICFPDNIHPLWGVCRLNSSQIFIYTSARVILLTDQQIQT